MNVLIMIGQFLLGLSMLVLFHEFGHYITARMVKARVDKFYVFYDLKFSIFRIKKINNKWKIAFFSKNVGDTYKIKMDEQGNPIKDLKGKYIYEDIDLQSLPDHDWRKYPESTEYGLGWLPFPIGGYCKINGMIDESMDTHAMKKAPQPWEFRSKTPWQRLLVMLGGIIMNLIVGIVIFISLILHYEKSYLPNQEVEKYGIHASTLAKEVGLQDGDKIIAVNGHRIKRFKDVQSPKTLLGATLTIERGGKQKEITLPSNLYKRVNELPGGFIEPFNIPLIIDSVATGLPANKAGIQKGDRIIAFHGERVNTYGDFKNHTWKYRGDTSEVLAVRGTDTLSFSVITDSSALVGIIVQMPYEWQDYDLINAIKYGTKDAFGMIAANAKGLGKMFTGEEKVKESLQGPIGIATIYGNVWIWAKFWYITGLLSLILAFMNIIPIPGLDGGHVIFTLWEIITGKKPKDKFLENAQVVGMIIILGLMVFAVGNDISRFF